MVTDALRRIPLSVRMFVYGVFFLAFVLAGLPWLAHRLDVYFPRLHIEAGPLVRAVGAVIFGVFLLIYLGASYLLTSRGRGAYVEFDPPTEFVCEGIYRWVRNPVAGSLLVVVFGEALMFSSTGILLLSLLGMVLAHVQVVRLEEPLLRQRFGAAYEAYCRSVPRWLPRRPRDEVQSSAMASSPGRMQG